MNFREVKKKIKTVKNVKKITSAMEMVSAVKMRKAQNEALQGREYRYALDKILRKIIAGTSDLKGFDIPWMKETEGKRTLIILVTSNKGLCGAFHSNLFRFCIQDIDMKNADFLTIGSKGAQFASQLGKTVIADFSESMPFTDHVSAIISLIEEKYATGEYKEVMLVYNNFISTIKSEPVAEVLLPVREIKALADVDGEQVADAHYLIEPSVEELLIPLVQDYIKEKLRGALVDSEAAEHSARMMAMKSATENAEELVYSLTLVGNKLRQTQITNELLDMIGAIQSSE